MKNEKGNTEMKEEKKEMKAEGQPERTPWMKAFRGSSREREEERKG